MTDITANSEIKSLGQVAFEAYRAEVQGVAYDGSGIPPWDSLDGDRAKAQRGWEAAAQAVRQHVKMIDALDATATPARDYRQEQRSRWQPLVPGAPGAWSAPVGEPEPEFSAPIGRGEAPTGQPVDVEATPDSDS